METPRKNQKKMLDINKNITEMKTFDKDLQTGHSQENKQRC